MSTILSRSTVSLLGFAFAAVWIASGFLASMLCLLSATCFAAAAPHLPAWRAAPRGPRVDRQRSRPTSRIAAGQKPGRNLQGADDPEPEEPREQYGW